MKSDSRLPALRRSPYTQDQSVSINVTGAFYTSCDLPLLATIREIVAATQQRWNYQCRNKVMISLVMMLSASAEHEHICRAYALGVDSFVRKPLDAGDLPSVARTTGWNESRLN